MTYSVSKKMIIITVLILLFLIPTGLIISLINDRHEYKKHAQLDVTSKWGKSQWLGNIVLYVPYSNGKTTDYLRILPNTLDITGNVEPEVRQRGIFKFILYKGNFKLKGDFKTPDLSKVIFPSYIIQWDRAFLQMDVSDLVGLKDRVTLKWNDQNLEFSSGIDFDKSESSCVTCPIAYNPLSNYNFEIPISIKGSEELYFLPNGKTTTVHLQSAWPDPGFIGAFLPDNHSIQKGKFQADWKILDLNRTYPQVWINSNVRNEFEKSGFGVKFLQPTDIYKQTTRAVKYMLLFVGLTFTLIFLIEIVNKKQIHPFQYILVGFSLIIFYLLLLSLSEQIGFALAYILSAAAVIIMIAFYATKMLGSAKFAVLTSIALTVLYGFLYILLINQDYSLLLGSLGLFVVLGLIMYYSGRINWYNED